MIRMYFIHKGLEFNHVNNLKLSGINYLGNLISRIILNQAHIDLIAKVKQFKIFKLVI